MIAIDYDPNNLAELHPMTYAMIEHCWRKDLKVLMSKTPEQLIRYRSKKIREVGHVNENNAKVQDLFGIFSKVFSRN